MDESLIKKTALLCAIIGLLFLYYISSFTPEITQISEISIEDVGRSMKICGQIEESYTSNNHIFFTLNDGTNNIKVVVFNTTALRLNETGNNIYGFMPGDAICIPGVVDEYPKNSGEVELIYRQGTIERIV
ncbi:MAG: OB-fold nucleic acid binding domain-containing protein [Candidatus Aenigmatarchaeota archaeon]